MEEAFDDPTFPIKVGQAISVEAFSPPVFAALCSPNLNVALTRLSHFKKLIGPMTLDITESPDLITASLDCLDIDSLLPAPLIATELIFLVHLARLATREHIEPLSVTFSVALAKTDSYAEYFGVSPTQWESNSITFSALDARRPFLTVNEHIWKFFEPNLRRRLSDMDAETDFATRVRNSLLELLPSGRSSIDDVARKLAVSRRTLQRRLSDESTNFQIELNKTREQLARHYLNKSKLSGSQISFLLGFEDPNSFFRAFHSWTGTTPNQLRASYN